VYSTFIRDSLLGFYVSRLSVQRLSGNSS